MKDKENKKVGRPKLADEKLMKKEIGICLFAICLIILLSSLFLLNINVFTIRRLDANTNSVSDVGANNYKLQLIGRFKFRMSKDESKMAYPQGFAISDKYYYFSYNPIGTYKNTSKTQIARCYKKKLRSDMNGVYKKIKNCEELIDNSILNGSRKKITNQEILSYIDNVEGHSQSFDVTKTSNGKDLLYVNAYPFDSDNGKKSRGTYSLYFHGKNFFKLKDKFIIGLDEESLGLKSNYPYFGNVKYSNISAQVATDNSHFAYGYYKDGFYIKIYNKNEVVKNKELKSTLVKLNSYNNYVIGGYQGIDIYKNNIYVVTGLPYDNNRFGAIKFFKYSYNPNFNNKEQDAKLVEYQELFSVDYLKNKFNEGMKIEVEGVSLDEKGNPYIMINLVSFDKNKCVISECSSDISKNKCIDNKYLDCSGALSNYIKRSSNVYKLIHK